LIRSDSAYRRNAGYYGAGCRDRTVASTLAQCRAGTLIHRDPTLVGVAHLEFGFAVTAALILARMANATVSRAGIAKVRIEAVLRREVGYGWITDVEN